jgi:hypothetical protein
MEITRLLSLSLTYGMICGCQVLGPTSLLIVAHVLINTWDTEETQEHDGDEKVGSAAIRFPE